MERRRFLLVLAAGLASASAGHGVSELLGPDRAPSPAPKATPETAAQSVAQPAAAKAPAAAQGLVPVVPPAGAVDALPGDGTSLALTIDDGTNSAVVAAFATFAADTGVRLTFFPNGRYRSWQDSAPALRPLVESGQVAFGNHTWSHPDLTTLADTEVAEEIRRNQEFLRRTFGIRDTPFFRPPYGAHDDRVDRIAADLGHPSVIMWDGTLGDSRLLSAAELISAAQEWFTAQRIVVGHANQPTVTTVYDDLLGLIAERGLRTVTLADVWATPSTRLRGTQAAGQVRR